MENRQKRYRLLALSLLGAAVLSGCGGEETGDGPKEVKLVLNWFPKAQMGGFFAAQSQAYYEDNDLDVDIEPGGPEVSAIQMVAAGQAEFGLAHADQILIARNQGIELVALAASLQESPQALMFHEGHGTDSFADINGRTAYIEPGIPYWDYLKSQYDLSDVTELAYNGQHVNFLENEEAVTQAFLTSEPFFLEREGIGTETLLISEAGYNPYNVVLFVTKDYLDSNKETVERFMEAYTAGWDYYKDHDEEVNEVIHEANENIALEELAYEAETQFEFVFGGDAKENGVGFMTEERWGDLIHQLVEIGQLQETVDPNEVFTTEFLQH
ncbi:ABC transporter permease [Shouchella clausii]|uniref:Thiamine pyrimidine synthase n=1 Tax=Shouchella clausii (strain KSM-K16) TaxID=66692 RepID=Q5WBI3_SHOC1|nr:ABC transporter substrate-binding protein [Shouchella clausii]MBX0318725.1 ABC transporter substrate-binding protein [Shouchella clausii]PAE81286.1 myristoyl transferase [Shouchella clausii]PAE96599.1 myristoyl transferase [Shouchella clausii]BAD66277.1 nitrate/sulfonate/bicarbonate ABC transporter substrate-binding protein [Shouchella clausii KSM-K16]GIN07927.1 ABC transporter permease [Shouchella clausii]